MARTKQIKRRPSAIKKKENDSGTQINSSQHLLFSSNSSTISSPSNSSINQNHLETKSPLFPLGREKTINAVFKHACRFLSKQSSSFKSKITPSLISNTIPKTQKNINQKSKIHFQQHHRQSISTFLSDIWSNRPKNYFRYMTTDFWNSTSPLLSPLSLPTSIRRKIIKDNLKLSLQTPLTPSCIRVVIMNLTEHDGFGTATLAIPRSFLNTEKQCSKQKLIQNKKEKEKENKEIISYSCEDDNNFLATVFFSLENAYLTTPVHITFNLEKKNDTEKDFNPQQQGQEKQQQLLEIQHKFIESLFCKVKEKKIFIESVDSFLDGKQTRPILRTSEKFCYTGRTITLYLHTKFMELHELLGIP